MIEPHIEFVNNYEFVMLPVYGGTFLIGGSKEDQDPFDNDKPQRAIAISDFLIGKFQVTQGLWKAVLEGDNPSSFRGDNLPVEQVSWDDVVLNFLPKLRRLTGLQYRLPTEAEWEYAARGGKYHDEGYKYAGSDRLKDVGWFSENSDGGTKPVGQKSANQLGIFDMSGNVDEWCDDDYHNNYQGAPMDGSTWVKVPKRGVYRVVRPGSWNYTAEYTRVTNRYGKMPDTKENNVGFRLALSVNSSGTPVKASI